MTAARRTLSDMAVSVVVAARETVRDAIRSPLVAAGLEIAAESSDLAEILEIVARRPPHLCVLDRDLPGAGVTTIAALTLHRPPPMVLVVGGRTNTAGIRADRLAGAARSMSGAIDAPDVVAALSELAEGLPR